jgi:hypothetical protein
MVIAFDARNGATRFVAGTYLQPAEPSEGMSDPRSAHADEVLACGPAGSIIIFKASVWHGHGANRSAARRRSIQAHFVPRDAQPSRRSLQAYVSKDYGADWRSSEVRPERWIGRRPEEMGNWPRGIRQAGGREIADWPDLAEQRRAAAAGEGSSRRTGWLVHRSFRSGCTASGNEIAPDPAN